MKKRILLLTALLLPGAGFAEKFAVTDKGDFAPAGQRVEFADRFGWARYEAKFDFGLEDGNVRLSRKSKLELKVVMVDGRTWKYACRAKDKQPLSARVHYLYGKGMSVQAECRVPRKEFAKAVGLDPEDVGSPSLVFQVVVENGAARAGAQRGFYFLPAVPVQSSDLNAYAALGEAPSSLAVAFRSN